MFCIIAFGDFCSGLLVCFVVVRIVVMMIVWL